MKALKVLIIAVAVIGVVAMNACAAGVTTTGPLNVKASVGSILEFGYFITPQGGLTSTTELNFGALQMLDGTLMSPGWFEMSFVITSNSPTWSLKSTATAITSGANTMPVGALKVNGPAQGATPVAANTAAAITVDSSATGVGKTVVVVYAMPTGTIPTSQKPGNYAGTVTITLAP